MKSGIRQVLGKTISGIVVTGNDKEPMIQLFLTFTDGTFFEIWGNSFDCCSELDSGGVAEVKMYAESQGATIQKTIVMIPEDQSLRKPKKQMNPKDMALTLSEEMYADILKPIFRNILVKKGLLPKDPSKK